MCDFSVLHIILKPRKFAVLFFELLNKNMFNETVELPFLLILVGDV